MLRGVSNYVTEPFSSTSGGSLDDTRQCAAALKLDRRVCDKPDTKFRYNSTDSD